MGAKRPEPGGRAGLGGVLMSAAAAVADALATVFPDGLSGVPAELLAHEPPEARGGGRDRVRLLLGQGDGQVSHHVFADLPDLLRPGDLLVVNTSATLPAALPATAPDGTPLRLHLSTELADRLWVVEPRAPLAGGATEPWPRGRPGLRLSLAGGGLATLTRPVSPPRLWQAQIRPALGSVLADLRAHGRPIRYGHVRRDWPLAAYQSVFADERAPGGPGSAEMPSAGRPFTGELVARLVSRGVLLAPITLHTGVSSAEADEKPYAEHFTVPAATAAAVRHTRAQGGRVVAVGTTVVRALESALDPAGAVRAADGWTDLVVTPARGVRAVDGLLTGFHEPRASHLWMLAALAGPKLLARCYRAALAGGYRWHEFGDVNLLLP